MALTNSNEGSRDGKSSALHQCASTAIQLDGMEIELSAADLLSFAAAKSAFDQEQEEFLRLRG